jgi:hypothetical protein
VAKIKAFCPQHSAACFYLGLYEFEFLLKSYDNSEAAYGMLFVVSDSVFGLRWLIEDDKIGSFPIPGCAVSGG